MAEIAKKKKKARKKSEPTKTKPMDKELTKKECNCQPLPKWVKYLVVILIITTFIICCILLHYLWKLSDIWQAVKNTK